MPENSSKPKVLVADDERLIADTLAMILNLLNKTGGYRIVYEIDDDVTAVPRPALAKRVADVATSRTLPPNVTSCQ